MFIVTKNNPYYPEVEYFDDIDAAKKKISEWQMDLHQDDGTHDTKLTLAEVVFSMPIKTHY